MEFGAFDRAGEQKYSEKTCPSATFSTTNLMELTGSNRGLRIERPVTNRSSLGSLKVENWWTVVCLMTDT